MLVINVSEDLKIRVSRLGEVYFKEGDYLYIGSAKGCLETRLQRHLKKEKRVFCQDPTTEIIKNGFGSSDCKCLTHLFFIKDEKKTEKILREIGFSIFSSSSN